MIRLSSNNNFSTIDIINLGFSGSFVKYIREINLKRGDAADLIKILRYLVRVQMIFKFRILLTRN